ncbi:MAG: GNAT family N-acetyltransferase [Solirubrobacteraceae bacterium]
MGSIRRVAVPLSDRRTARLRLRRVTEADIATTALRRRNLYYRFAPELQGRGLAAEATRGAIAVARELRPEWPVVARTRPENEPAGQVLPRSPRHGRTSTTA